MKNKGKRVLAAVLGALMAMNCAGGPVFFNKNASQAYAQTATVNATTLNVRSGPGTGYSLVARLNHGASVSTIGETTGTDGALWYQIQYASGTETKTGYVSASYLKFPVTYTQDANFEAYLNSQGFPESYKESLRTLHAEHPSWVFQAQHTGLDWNTVIDNESAVGANLVDSGSISSWKSTAYGAYDWNTGTWPGFDGASWVAASREIVAYYMDPRNFLNDTYVFQFLLHTYDGASQTKEGLQSMVTGTFLEKAAVSQENGGQSPESGDAGTQSGSGAEGSQIGPGSDSSSGQTLTPGQNVGPGFETTAAETVPAQAGPGQTGNSGTGTSPASGTQDVGLEGPALTVSARILPTVALPDVEYGPGMDASSITGDNTGSVSESPAPAGQSYVDIIMNAAAQSGVNPYVLAAMILQEQGSGTSGSISGVTSGYEGYYNFFNIGAYASDGMSPVTRGLWYASQTGSYGRPWNSIEKSIVGGAQYYGENFVKQGQDTFYLKKFNVQGNNLYKHQYMTNVEAAAGEGAKLSRAYTDAMKSQTLTFKIPVFNNMPETACAKPAVDGSPNNKLSSLSVEGYTLTPTFNMDTESYDIIVNPSVGTISVSASAIDSKAVVSGTGMVNLQSGNNTVKIEVKAENGDVRTYQLNVVRQSDAPVVTVNPGGTQGSTAGSGGTSGPGGTSGSGSTAGPGSTAGSGSTSGPGSTSGSQPAGGSGNAAAGSGGQSSGPGSETGTPGVSQSSPGETTAAGLAGASGTGQPATATRPVETENTGTTASVETAAPAPAETTAAPTTAPTAAPQTAAPETAAPAETTAAQASSRKKGDCNGDGTVSILDVMLIRQHVLGQKQLSGDAAAAADVNGDGAITSADADALQSQILGG